MLYILDEPTTGLHFDDIAKLLAAFRKLLQAGHSLLVIEHNLDVIKTADWIIDLGPEGGEEGGRIVATGTPEQVAQVAASHTGRYLRDVARRRPLERVWQRTGARGRASHRSADTRKVVYDYLVRPRDSPMKQCSCRGVRGGDCRAPAQPRAIRRRRAQSAESRPEGAPQRGPPAARSRSIRRRSFRSRRSSTIRSIRSSSRRLRPSCRSSWCRTCPSGSGSALVVEVRNAAGPPAAFDMGPLAVWPRPVPPELIAGAAQGRRRRERPRAARSDLRGRRRSRSRRRCRRTPSRR